MFRFYHSLITYQYKYDLEVHNRYALIGSVQNFASFITISTT